ncbi:MAG: glutamate-5-semialdehyde dehydrogenase [Dehalococcoidales bacterium]|jgi:glutamate-5-semialdehyde dehydrogenase|nr:glutamate-5-semialdehyde dehydrogenase [Dehalococcoidales bacterium]
MSTATEGLETKVKAAKEASRKLASLSADIKNRALHNIADNLLTRQDAILAANEADCKEAAASGMNQALLDRLTLSPSRLEGIASDVRAVAALPDPVGELFDGRALPNGLVIIRKRVPFGVMAAIYESRPNVTIDISVLCLKSSNAIVLRGGKEAIHSNGALAALVRDSITQAGMPADVVQFIENTDRTLINHLLTLNKYIDLIVPRGGAELIEFIRANASMPVIAAGDSVCHTYVDKSADLHKAVAIADNAKVQRPSVCNALDTLLVDADVAQNYLPMLAAEWAKAGVEMHCDERALSILKADSSLRLVPALAEDWGKEFLALVAAVKVVDSLDEALDHIARYGSGADEAIVSEDYSAVARFLNEVDASCVYVNASTRFTDGGQFGLGAEVAISTQKMHARGPIGLKELTTYKWIIHGTGQVRP